jgi:hypothetical protein
VAHATAAFKYQSSGCISQINFIPMLISVGHRSRLQGEEDKKEEEEEKQEGYSKQKR